MSYHKAKYLEHAASARRAAAAETGRTRDALLNNAAVHETWAEHYDSLPLEGQRLLDFAASPTAAAAGVGVVCGCTEHSCGCEKLDSNDDNAPASGVEADAKVQEARAEMEHRRGTLRFPSGRIVTPGGSSREEMIARRNKPWSPPR